MEPHRRRLIQRCLIGAVVGFGVLQGVRPRLSSPAVTADLEAPPRVKSLLAAACYDCHSNETKLLWFDRVVPAYWLVARDVEAGRRHLNFSEIGKLPPAKQRALLFESLNQTELGAMPPRPYRLLHPSARLGAQDIATLRAYLAPDANAVPPATSPEKAATAAAELTTWQSGAKQRPPVEPAPNGMRFFDDYRSWRALSTTDRFDNATLRLILANPVAEQALPNRGSDPWPDGSAFAKLAWARVVDSEGKVSAGQFKQIEFMLKDRKTYADTHGWGFARWLGPRLVPYGKDAGFVNECVGCHEPMRENDYVFTIPVEQPEVPRDFGVLTTSLDLRSGTMSTLYGNELARTHALGDGQARYPVGAKLLELSWKQREDPHWFGARIPGAPRARVAVSVDTTNSSSDELPSARRASLSLLP